MTPETRAALRAQLKRHEGFKLRVYNDTKGIPTIGCGRNLRDKGISVATGEQMLTEDIEEVEADLNRFAWFPHLDSVRQVAIMDMRFQLGYGTFRTFKKMLSALERHDYEAAGREAIDSDWAVQVQPSRRAKIFLMLTEGRE